MWSTCLICHKEGLRVGFELIVSVQEYNLSPFLIIMSELDPCSLFGGYFNVRLLLPSYTPTMHTSMYRNSPSSWAPSPKHSNSAYRQKYSIRDFCSRSEACFNASSHPKIHHPSPSSPQLFRWRMRKERDMRWS